MISIDRLVSDDRLSSIDHAGAGSIIENACIYLQCCVGSKVHMRVGGNFYFDPKPDDSCPDLLLIAGGVGINPVYSIVRHVADISPYQHTGKTVLLFSAQNQDELLFKVHQL